MTPTVADELAFAALPPETQELARRVLLGGAEIAPPALLAIAYRAGFEDAINEVDLELPSCSKREASEAVTTYLGEWTAKLGKGAVS